ncbi:hypothetical protein [Longimicrobium sp.]|uniref:hypothetical protein n=1 Tax=Longimicrobium sp. TaxID=2029185 RepID=UPI002BFFCECF|nr:hypothetical protein [Longimicrobium sp.]HSU15475.1 hypothetical protein [Longimicrobium sp.]
MPGKKIKLQLDDLNVKTFDPVVDLKAALGTVHGNEEMPPSYDLCTWASYCPSRCGFTSCC